MSGSIYILHVYLYPSISIKLLEITFGSYEFALIYGGLFVGFCLCLFVLFLFSKLDFLVEWILINVLKRKSPSLADPELDNRPEL